MAATALVVDTLKRLETQRIVTTLLQLQHGSDMLLAQTHLAEEQASHAQHMQAVDDEVGRLRQQLAQVRGGNCEFWELISDGAD
jgi:hypothetical protein